MFKPTPLQIGKPRLGGGKAGNRERGVSGGERQFGEGEQVRSLRRAGIGAAGCVLAER